MDASHELEPARRELIYDDCLFPTDNDLEIPTLRLDRQPQVVSIPFLAFGEQKRTHNMMGNGTLHFYVDDYRFRSVYDHPEKILAHNPRNIVEPNFSLFNETPVAFGLQAIYKKRMVSRLMQENGLGVFVDLNVAPKFYKLNAIGIPPGYSSFCTRGYSDRIAYLEFEYKMAQSISGKESPLFVCYGGGGVCKKFCQKVGAIYITPVVTIKHKQKQIEAINESIAFFKMPETEVQERISGLWDGQVQDFRETPMIEEKHGSQ